MKKIELTQNKYAIVDDEDYKYLSQFSWYANKAASLKFYARNRSLGLMHRYIFQANELSVEVDHINGDSLDNRKCNLRLCTKQQNLFNKRKYKNNTTGFKGVYVDGRIADKPYRAILRANKKRYNLGYFSDPAEAAEAYKKAAKRYFGEFAPAN